ncbi:MAG: uroporphyrinogen-III C-methyltransferase [Proteobacteria bacterium]|nr:uroporphyrinogen-III C-methyltransferase [Pseudomonadota bacterium]
MTEKKDPDKVAGSSAEASGSEPAPAQKPKIKLAAKITEKETAKAVDKSTKMSDKKPVTPNPAKPASSGRSIAMLALLLAIVAIGWGYWREFQSQEVSSSALTQSSNENKRLQSEIEGLQASIKAMGGKIVGEDVLQPKLDKLDSRIDAVSSSQLQQADVETALQSRLASLEQVFSGLDDRQQVTESTLSSLALNKQATDRDVALAEVTFLVRVAAQRLELFNDQPAAIELLQLADQQLASQGEQLFNPVRHRIQQDLLAINVIKAPDVVAITGQLLALEQSVGQWQAHLPERREDTGGENTVSESDLVAKLSYLVNSLVTIREDQGNSEFLTISQAERMKDRIRLELQAARVAAIAGQTANYQGSVNRVSNWMREYFDPSVAANAAALNSLDELASVNLNPQWPDLNPLLVLTRQMQSIPVNERVNTPVEAGMPAEASPEPEA